MNGHRIVGMRGINLLGPGSEVMRRGWARLLCVMHGSPGAVFPRVHSSGIQFPVSAIS